MSSPSSIAALSALLSHSPDQEPPGGRGADLQWDYKSQREPFPSHLRLKTESEEDGGERCSVICVVELEGRGKELVSRILPRSSVEWERNHDCELLPSLVIEPS